MHLRAGFLPLFDSLLLVLAHERGFAARHGLSLELVRESSWANIRDRSALGHFEVAQMLAPMPIAASLGLTPIATAMIAPVVLGLGNNGVTVSVELWARMAAEGALPDLQPGPTGQALARVVRTSPRPLRFGVVHQTSSHNYELRYWLAASGIRPDVDVAIVVLPPPLLPEALGAGSIDGYCVGEPWNSVGVTRHGAHIATLKTFIWRQSPDKVLGMRAQWADREPEAIRALIRAVYEAGVWASDADNAGEIARIMAGPGYLDLPEALVLRALTGGFDIGGGRHAEVPDHFVPSAGLANFPWTSHALWFYSQMVRWGEVAHSPERAASAAAAFRPDLYRSALAALDAGLPATDGKREGDGDGGGFFDGVPFDPDRLEDYLARQTS